jgi:hypothetical protein
MKKWIWLVALVAQTFVEGALPPFWEDDAELKAILEDSRLGQFFDSSMIIDAISKNNEGWEIKSGKLEVIVKVKEMPQQKPGPQKFTLEFLRK